MTDETPKNDGARKKGLLKMYKKKQPLMKGFDRVLVSVDFSSASRLAVQLAQSIVSANGVVYAIHVIPVSYTHLTLPTN